MRDLGAFSAYSIIGTVTLMTLLVLPALVGVLVDESGFSAQQAGWVATANFSGSALIAILMAFHIHRIDLRRAARMGLVLAVAGELLSAWTVQPVPGFLLLRFATGVCTGMAHVAAIAAFARHTEMERGYGLFVTLQFLVSGLGLYVLPVHSATLGATGMYLGFALLAALALPLVAHLPGPVNEQRPKAAPGGERKVLGSAVALLAVLGYCLFEAANTAQFTYIERFGVSHGIDEQRLGLALMVASLIGIPGSFSIVFLGGRFGDLAPISLAIATGICGLGLLLAAQTYAAYFVASCLLGFAWAFGLPYISSLMARIDTGGSVIAAGSALATLGGSIGPGLAAWALGAGWFDRVFWLAISMFFLAWLAFFLSRMRAGRHYPETQT